MKLNHVKLVVTDMDGTLLNTTHHVSPLFFSLFEKLTALNITFVAASGRPLYSMVDKFSRIKDDLILVAENGGLGVRGNHTLFSVPLKTKHFEEICIVLEKVTDAHPVFCCKDKAYVKTESKQLIHLLKEYYPKYELIDSVTEISEPVYKIALYHEQSSERFIYPYVKPLEDKFKVKLSATHWVDISELDANKGTALRLIQDSLNITPAETMAFGDYNNDLEMLENAYFSYAMANAHENVKAIARFSTKSNTEFGVEVILQSLLRAKLS